jgi:hypothetical protein
VGNVMQAEAKAETDLMPKFYASSIAVFNEERE